MHPGAALCCAGAVGGGHPSWCGEGEGRMGGDMGGGEGRGDTARGPTGDVPPRCCPPGMWGRGRGQLLPSPPQLERDPRGSTGVTLAAHRSPPTPQNGISGDFWPPPPPARCRGLLILLHWHSHRGDDTRSKKPSKQNTVRCSPPAQHNGHGWCSALKLSQGAVKKSAKKKKKIATCAACPPPSRQPGLAPRPWASCSRNRDRSRATGSWRG